MRTSDHWDAQLYDNHHSFVSEYGSGIVTLLDPKCGEKILDVGCGTGDLMFSLSQSGAFMHGVDQSEAMILKARQKYSDLLFEVKSVLDMEFKEEYDAVFSNATLHWVKESKLALERIFQSLKPGGRFVAEFGGEGNVEKIIDELLRQMQREGNELHREALPWYFPSIGEYTSLMEAVGFKVKFAQHLARPTLLEGSDGLKHWIEMFAPSLLNELPLYKRIRIIQGVQDQLKSVLYKDNKWEADYKRIRVIGIRP